MDAVFKVCDAMENIAFSASTVVPKSFVCGGSQEDGSADFVISGCGVVTSNYASHDVDFGAEENSVCVRTNDEDANSVTASVVSQPQSKQQKPLHVSTDEERQSKDNKASMALFGVPLNWPHVVKKTSSWSSVSQKTVSTSYSSYSSGSGKTPVHRRDDSISMHESPQTQSSKTKNQMEREQASFGKSREFRSFGSKKSLEENSVSSLLRPTYMSSSESKQHHEDSSGYKYILKRTPSGRSSTVSQPDKYTTMATTQLLESSAARVEEPSPSSSSVFETSFLTPFPKLYSA